MTSSVFYYPALLLEWISAAFPRTHPLNYGSMIPSPWIHVSRFTICGMFIFPTASFSDALSSTDSLSRRVLVVLPGSDAAESVTAETAWTHRLLCTLSQTGRSPRCLSAGRLHNEIFSETAGQSEGEDSERSPEAARQGSRIPKAAISRALTNSRLVHDSL